MNIRSDQLFLCSIFKKEGVFWQTLVSIKYLFMLMYYKDTTLTDTELNLYLNDI